MMAYKASVQSPGMRYFAIQKFGPLGMTVGVDSDSESDHDNDGENDRDSDDDNVSPAYYSSSSGTASAAHLSRHAASAAAASGCQVGCLAPDPPELGRGALCFLPGL